MIQAKRQTLAILVSALLALLMATPVLADEPTYPFGNSVADNNSQFLGPFDYDFGGYTWMPVDYIDNRRVPIDELTMMVCTV